MIDRADPDEGWITEVDRVAARLRAQEIHAHARVCVRDGVRWIAGEVSFSWSDELLLDAMRRYLP